jgi:ectoine hydroxylase-related dioxygenase (phytanoyl-CoA dioxygenase family)
MKSISEFESLGFTLILDFLEPETIEFLAATLETIEFGKETKKRGEAAFGIRNLLNVVPEIRNLAESNRLKELVESILGTQARVVRGIFFDKTPEANWKVPLHQDLTVAVRERIETKGFSAWTNKSGIQHVQPPVSILEKMLTVRIHLDDADETNGALKVVPKSHLCGRVSAEQAHDLREKNGFVLCEVKRCGAMLMKPLLLHASSASIKPKRRRVVHLEFAAEDLPNG